LSVADPKLSIVFPTCHAWPDAKPTLMAILDAESPPDLEVILCDGHGAGGPPETERDPRLKVVVAPGESVFGLRAKGVALARGEIVAITEDHCTPAPDWPREVVAAHERHPDMVGIAGAVANGSTGNPWDWANFLMTFADHMRPLPSGDTCRAPSVANGSVKRAAAGIPADPAPGWFEIGLQADLMEAGKVTRDGGPLVTHIQSQGGGWATLVAHFHNGRACTGIRSERPGLGAVRAEARRLASRPLLLVRELRHALAQRPPLEGKAAAGARLVPVIALAHTAGELTGLLAGPGRSAEKLD
jgi:hypothetical protein